MTDTAYSAFSSPSAASKLQNEKQHPAKAETPENMLPDDHAEEEIFDLRRAIIYSELLKPKFDE